MGDGIGAEYPLSCEKGDPNVPEENCCACERDMQSGDGLASAKLLRIQQHDVLVYVFVSVRDRMCKFSELFLPSTTGSRNPLVVKKLRANF